MENTLKAIIVDDEESARKVLNSLLIKFCPQIEVVALCKDLLEAKQKIEELTPDVVFLDIEMPQYAGFEIVNFFDKINFEIVFVTAYDKYAIRAFEVSALDYLLKPIEIARLKLTVAKLFETTDLKRNYQILRENLANKEIQKLMIKKNNGRVVVNVQDIIAIQAKESYCSIITEKDSFITSKNLKHYESYLEDNNLFFRTHKSWLINKKHIVSFSKYNMEIALEKNITAKLSKYKKNSFEEFILQ
jgi:two-component system LytT family response regulator